MPSPFKFRPSKCGLRGHLIEWLWTPLLQQRIPVATDNLKWALYISHAVFSIRKHTMTSVQFEC